MKKSLGEKVLGKIEDYLSGKISKKEVSEWAISILRTKSFSSDELLLEDAITALAGLHDDDDRWDTAREDIVYYKNCILGNTPYTMSVEFLPKPAKRKT